MRILHTALAIAHALASAAWFGSIFYSLTVLQPRAKTHFKTDAELEEFMSTLAHGARWKVLAAFTMVGVTGVGLIVLVRPRLITTRWIVLIVGKSILFTIALVVFCYGSWRLWPRRIFATPEELPAIRRQFRLVGSTLLALVGAAIALGVVAHAW